MSFNPTIKLYADNGVDLVYTFEHVLDLPDQITDNPASVKLESLRSRGAIIIPGGDKSYSFKIKGVLTAVNYTTLIAVMKTLKTAVANNTNFILKVDTSISTQDSYNVKRLTPISWAGPARKTNIQYYTVDFLCDSWV